MTKTNVFIDFETNAIGGFRPPTQTPIQISYAIDNSEIKSYYIKGATEISDSFNPMNLTVDFLNQNGITVEQTIHKLINDINQHNPEEVQLIAHNADFDSGILDNMLAQTGITLPWKTNWFCTMKNTTMFCQIPSKFKNKEFKFPRLSELADKLNVKTLEDKFHAADYDVFILRECWKEAQNLSIFSPS